MPRPPRGAAGGGAAGGHRAATAVHAADRHDRDGGRLRRRRCASAASGKVEMRFDPTHVRPRPKGRHGPAPEAVPDGHRPRRGPRPSAGGMPGAGSKVDQNPGIELRQAGFRDYFLDAMRQQKAFYERTKLPVAVEIVDEPREVPNPWNRNLADTIRYGDMLREAGLTTFVTPMSDTQRRQGLHGPGRSRRHPVGPRLEGVGEVHAARRARRRRRSGCTTPAWTASRGASTPGASGPRAAGSGTSPGPRTRPKGGYPGREWHNPFTASHGLASDAPPSYPGAMLFQLRLPRRGRGNRGLHLPLYSAEAAATAGPTSAAHAATVKEARAFLAALKRAIPEFPEIKGLGSAEDGALVGMGVSDEARLQTPAWRERVVEVPGGTGEVGPASRAGLLRSAARLAAPTPSRPREPSGAGVPLGSRHLR